MLSTDFLSFILLLRRNVSYKSLCCLCRKSSDFVINRSQHLLNARVRNSRLSPFKKRVHAFDYNAEGKGTSCPAPKPVVDCPLRHLVANSYKDTLEAGLAPDSSPKCKSLCIVRTQWLK